MYSLKCTLNLKIALRNYFNTNPSPEKYFDQLVFRKILLLMLKMQGKSLTFFESSNLLNQFDIGLVSSLIPEETTKWRNAGITYESYEVQCYNWDYFLTTNGLKNEKFDIISIDIEGMDYEVLSQMNLTELGCKILCVEFNGANKSKYVEYANKFKGANELETCKKIFNFFMLFNIINCRVTIL